MSIIRNALLYCTIEDGGDGFKLNEQLPVYIDDVLYGYVSSTIGKISAQVIKHGKGLVNGTYYVNASGKNFVCSTHDTGLGTVIVTSTDTVDSETGLTHIANSINVTISQKIKTAVIPTISFNLPTVTNAAEVEQPQVKLNSTGPITSWLSVWEKTNSYPWVFDSLNPSISIQGNDAALELIDPGQPYIAPSADYSPGQPYIAPTPANPGQPYIAPTYSFEWEYWLSYAQAAAHDHNLTNGAQDVTSTPTYTVVGSIAQVGSSFVITLNSIPSPPSTPPTSINDSAPGPSVSLLEPNGTQYRNYTPTLWRAKTGSMTSPGQPYIAPTAGSPGQPYIAPTGSPGQPYIAPTYASGSSGGNVTLKPIFGDFSIPDAGGWGSTLSTKNTIKNGIIGTEPNSWNFEMKYMLIAIFEQLIADAPGVTREDKIFNVLNCRLPTQFDPVTNEPLTDYSDIENIKYKVLGNPSAALAILDLILQPLTQFEVTFGEAAKLARALTVLPLIKDGKTFNEIQSEMKNPTRIL